MVNKQIILKLLRILENSLTKIRNMDFTEDMILGDEDVQDLLDRRLQKAVEASIDIAAHICATKKLNKGETSSDLFLILAKEGIIPQELAERLIGAVGLRNIIVHQYADIDYKLAYFNLEDKLKDLEKFAVKIKNLLE